jgi:hypothetical protein
MTIFKKLWTSLRNSVMDPPITPEILRQRYSAMNDVQLNTINEKELTPMAAEAYKAELTSRKHKP